MQSTVDLPDAVVVLHSLFPSRPD